MVSAALLAWLVIGVGASVSVSGVPPELAHRAWPSGSAPEAALALERLREGARRDLDQAAALASSALLREPVSAAAARTLGLIQAAGGATGAADRSMAVAEGLSRRDLPTQYYWIQRTVLSAMS